MSNERELEKLLRRFSPKPAPRELREKVIQAAHREASGRRILTPAWRWALATSLILLALIAVADCGMSSAEQARLSVLLGLPSSEMVQANKAPDKQAADILAGLPDISQDSQKLLREVLLRKEQGGVNRRRQSVQRLAEEINEY
jgi:hypothetical protein